MKNFSNLSLLERIQLDRLYLKKANSLVSVHYDISDEELILIKKRYEHKHIQATYLSTTKKWTVSITI